MAQPVRPTGTGMVTTPCPRTASGRTARLARWSRSPSSPRLGSTGLVGLILVLGAVAGCGDGDDARSAAVADRLALTSPSDPSLASTEVASTSYSSSSGADGDVTARRPRGSVDPEPVPPIPDGTVDEPFAPLPAGTPVRAVRTAGGVVMPVIDERPSSWLVSTSCENVRFVRKSEAEPIGRAHIVLDPGHGGVEVGAVGATGLTEKDLNLRVARRAAEILRQAGATVVLTRDGDHTVTAGTRGLIAAAVQPALLVSIHHNGGAPAGPGGPGTIVFTKAGSDESTRFGGLFHQTLQPMLNGAAETVRERHRAWLATVAEYEAAVAAHEASVEAREALVADGQIPPDTIPPPPPLDAEPVAEFQWAGSGNAGVRSWVRADGKDHLAVLRRSGSVPAVLAEFLYLTNPSEEALLAEEGFVDKEAGVLADAVVLHMTGNRGGTGFVGDQYDDEPIGNSGGIDDCVEPSLG